MRVLLVNDDGPPAPHSPHVLGLYEELRRVPGWQVSVVIPSAQKSWGSMAFTLHPPCSAWYYYPRKGNYDGTHEHTSESWSATRRPVKDDEAGEWILVDGSPTTCTNIGLFSLDTLQPRQDATSSSTKPAFDLVISGPNFGRNSGTAFSLCSGTIGAALAASLSGVRAISISYAHFMQANKLVNEATKVRDRLQSSAKEKEAKVWGQLPDSAPSDVVQRAHQLSVKLVQKLYAEWEADVGVYTVNVPLSWHLFDESDERGSKVYWTRTWDSQFGPLFALDEQQSAQQQAQATPRHKPKDAPAPSVALRFAPNMSIMLQPKDLDDPQAKETDIWAILNGYISVARLSPSYTAVTPSQNKSDVRAPGSHFKL